MDHSVGELKIQIIQSNWCMSDLGLNDSRQKRRLCVFYGE